MRVSGGDCFLLNAVSKPQPLSGPTGCHLSHCSLLSLVGWWPGEVGMSLPASCDTAVTPYPGHLPVTVPSCHHLTPLPLRGCGEISPPSSLQGWEHTEMEQGLLHIPWVPVRTVEWGPAARAVWECWDSPRTDGAVRENSIQGSHAQPLPFPLGPNSVPCPQTPGPAPSGGRGVFLELPGSRRELHVPHSHTAAERTCSCSGGAGGSWGEWRGINSVLVAHGDPGNLLPEQLWLCHP